MGNDLAAFFRSLNAGSFGRIALTVALTTTSVYAAFRERATPGLIIGCNLVTVCGAFWMEYRSFQSRR